MDKSDEEYIGKNVKKESEPLPWEKKPMIRYQWSDKRDNEIFVVETTGESLETFVDKVQDVKNQYGLNITIPPVPNITPPLPKYVPPVQTPPIVSEICEVCGAKAEIKSGTSKKGNAYKIKKCTASPELVENGGHSRFLK